MAAPIKYTELRKKKRATKYPCRCNNRSCHARISLKKHPNAYIRPPKCKGCGGNDFYVDWNRIAKPDNSCGGKVCKLDCLPFPHRVNTKGCRQYQKHLIERSLKKTNGGAHCEGDNVPF